jgi:cell division initiation protein
MKRLSEDLDDKITTSNESFKKVNVQVHAKVVEELSRAKAFTYANMAAAQVDESPMTKQTLPEEINENPVEKAEESVADNYQEETVENIQSETEEKLDPVEEPKAKVNHEVEEPVENKEEEIEEENPGDAKAKPDKGSSFFDQFD